MTRVSLIAIVDQQNGLGKDNQLLCHLPADLAHFKALTLGKPIIMGRKTFESLGKPLPGRRNIVLSRHHLEFDGVEVCDSIQAAMKLISTKVVFEEKLTEEVMVIGGAQVYQDALALADRIYLTRIEYQFIADVFFPQLDERSWQCVSQTYRAPDEKNPYALSFCQYERVLQEKI
jgi:dihydrofolate reductase